ncbi:MAG TPA: family 43 glycosylhydrolase, partial [Acidimicrobiales bacterium]|nr:family 43 glycosylhydrolase [Acidimicrobiales bacterium]
MVRRRAAPALLLVVLGAPSVAALATAFVAAPPAAAASVSAHVAVSPSPNPAFAGDAPDPDVVYSGGTYYAFTTGTQLGNHLQALVDTSGSPAGGWASYTGHSYGSTALPSAPSWEQPDTQTSPGVMYYGGHWVMFYDASQAGHPEDSGYSCISVATATSLTPTSPVFHDGSTGPITCGTPGVGVLDPSPFVDPSGHAYLLWKSNDGSSSAASQVFSAPLDPTGTALAGPPTVLLTVDQPQHPWETTTDDPQMVFADGTYELLFSAGNFTD